MKNLIVCFCVVALTVLLPQSCSAVIPQNLSQYSRDNASIVVNTTIANQTINFGRNTTVKFQGGRFKNCRLQGNKTTIIADNATLLFDGCTFSGTFINSTLKATHFGSKPDMISVPYTWKSKDGTKVKTKIRQGFDNKKSLESIAQFCSRSNNVTIVFDGAFFTPVVDNRPGKPERDGNYLTIKKATHLTLKGGTLIQGIFFYNCSEVSIQGINFVGLHEKHDFPPIYYTSSCFSDTKGTFYSAIKSSKLTKDNTANINVDQYASLGLAGTSTIRFMTEDGGVSKNIEINNCNFEMRTGGIGTGSKTERSDIRNVLITNCRFSHIYFQPLGFTSVTSATVDDVTADYCLQSVDIGRWANHVVVKNSKFYDCFSGPKQQLAISQPRDTADCHSNVFDGCYFQITDKLKYIDIEPYILLTGQAGPHSEFIVRNSTFEMKNKVKSQGIMSRINRLVLDNVSFNIDCSSLTHKTDFSRLFNTGAALLLSVNYKPQIALNNVTINTNNTRIGYIASPAGPTFDLVLNHFKIQGKGICTYSAFAGLNKLAINNASFAIACNNSFVEKTPDVSFNNVSCLNVKDMIYNSGGLTGNLNVDIRNSHFKAKGRFLNLYKASNARVNIAGCDVDCSTFVRMVDDPRSLSMDIRGNTVKTTAGEVFTGIETARHSFVPEKVKVSENKFSSINSAALYSRSAKASVRKIFSNNTILGGVRQP